VAAARRIHRYLQKQVQPSVWGQVASLTQIEEVLFRTVMRLPVTLPREVGENLVHERGITAAEYTVHTHLSGAPNREMRITDLASATATSVSRMSRLLDELQTRKPVVMRRSESDGLGNLACLTGPRFAALKSADPDHLASVRRLVTYRIDRCRQGAVARVLEAIAISVDEAERRPWTLTRGASQFDAAGSFSLGSWQVNEREYGPCSA
jgi:DNA-binding MarR family transcriptional regulator